MKTITTYILIIAVLLICSSGTAGQIYKWVDGEGNTHFSSSPPSQGQAETIQPKINIYTSVKPSKGESRKSVTIYSAVWCGVCRKAKNYFREHQIPFSEYDVETSEKGRRDYKRLNGTGVPIILIGGERMNGFSAERFEGMYGG